MEKQAKMAGSPKGGMVSPRKANDVDESNFLGRVAARLKELRASAGLDHESASKAITKAGYSVAASTIYRWEAGTTQPHIEAMPAIAKAYKTKLRTILPAE